MNLAEYALESQEFMGGLGDGVEDLTQQFTQVQERLNEVNLDPLARTEPFKNRLAQVQGFIQSWLPRLISISTDPYMMGNAQSVVDRAFTDLDSIQGAMADYRNKGQATIATSTYRPNIVQTISAPVKAGQYPTVTRPMDRPASTTNEVVAQAKQVMKDYGPWIIAGAAVLAFGIFASGGKGKRR